MSAPVALPARRVLGRHVRVTAELLALCRELDIPATRIHRIDELPEHPHLKAVGLFQRSTHPAVGPMVSVRPTTLFGRTPAQLALPAPLA